MPALGGLMLVGALGLGAASDSARDRYDLDFRDSASAIARVEARVTVVDGALYVEAYTTQQPGFWPRAGNIAGAEYLCFGTPTRSEDASSHLISGKFFGGCSTSVASGTIAGLRE